MTIIAKRPGRSGLARHARAGAVALLLGGVAVLATPAAASAHVTVQPGDVEGGGFSVVAFRVPNERPDAATTRLQVVLPAKQPLASVQTTPITGWTVSTKQRTLAEPIDFFGTPTSTVVSTITWTATAGGVQPGQFQDFEVSLGVLPESGKLTFKAVQTYSSGEVVAWNEVAVGDAEPEHPAPVLNLTAPAAATGDGASTDSESRSADDSRTAALETGSGSTSSEDDSNSTIPLALSLAALLASIAALMVAWRRTAKE